jgi:hypothetical protein
MSKHARDATPIKEPGFFCNLEPTEHRNCRDYLFSQEIVRQEKLVKRDLRIKQCEDAVPGLVRPGELKTIIRNLRPEAWLLSRVAMIRRAWRLWVRRIWRLQGSFTTARIPETPVWSTHPAARLAVLWPEWPKTDYFSIPSAERLRRIASFSAKDQLADQADQAYLLNPHNPATRKKAVVQIAILASATPQSQLEAFKALLRIHAPELFCGSQTPPINPQGRKSEEARILDDLHAIAAYQLCKVEQIPRKQAIQLICYPPGHRHAGKPVYSGIHELNKPLRSFPKRLEEFRADIMHNLVPLQPFGVVSGPDWALLDQAIATYPKQWVGSPSDIAELEELINRFRVKTGP